MSRFSIESVFKAIDQVSAPVTRMQNRIGKMTRSIESNLNSINRRVDKITGGIGSMASTVAVGTGVAITAAAGGIAYLVSQYSKIEDAEAAFTPLIGGADKAKKLIEELNKTAASTPFEFNDIAATAKQLLPVMNGDIAKTVDTLKMLGDTAGGNAQKLDSITRGFTKAMLKGKVDMESLNMIGEAGVPIFTELAASMGKKVNAGFFKMISAGKVATQQLTAAFQKMTSEGGIFFKGMEISSMTISGMMSTLSDNVSLAAADIGKELAPTIKELIVYATEITQSVRDWVSNNKDLIKTKIAEFVVVLKNAVKNLIDKLSEMNSQYSLMDRAIDILAAIGAAIGFVVKYGEGIIKTAIVLGGLIIVLKTFLLVMTAINVVMSLNPFGLMVLGVVALVAGLALAVVYAKELLAWLSKIPLLGRFIVVPILKLNSALVDVIMLMKDGIKYVVDKAAKIGGMFGFEVNDETQKNKNSDQQIISPQERTARSIEETRTTSSADVTIKDDTGRAAVTRGKLGSGVKLIPSGAF